MARYFTEDHEWIDVDGDVATIGITDYAQGQLGDIVFVEIPSEGTELAKGKEAAVVESVKAASDVYAPVSGTVVEVNDAAVDNPALVADEPYTGGWLIRVEPSNPGDWDALLTPEQYEEVIASDGEH